MTTGQDGPTRRKAQRPVAAGGGGTAPAAAPGIGTVRETARPARRPAGRVSTPDAASAPWLREALRELAEIGEGVEVEGPTPSAEVVAEARALLRHLAEWADGAPAVDDDADGGVSVEFYGRKGCRLLLIVESDGSAVYQELVAGRVTSQGFTSWRQLLKTRGRAAFRRTGVPIRGEPEATA